MDETKAYDCAVLGGGVAGLALCVQLATAGKKVVLFEKNRYPFHKVCGEYISNESLGFFLRLGLPLNEWNLPKIGRIGISSEKGYMFNARLPLGGFGISRYRLDNEMALLARKKGAHVFEETKVRDVKGDTIITSKGNFTATVIVAAHGKLNPVYSEYDSQKKPQQNYIGVKYHIETEFPDDRIELHNFTNGYCGLSKVEDNRFCLCYISNTSNLNASGNSIRQMEARVLSKNPFLKAVFTNAQFIERTPVTVSNISFGVRKLYDEKMIYLGDAAGCISPLTGNGMSMAGYASQVLCDLIMRYLKGEIPMENLKTQYAARWNETFKMRIQRGRRLQYLFGHKHFSDLALRIINPFEAIKKRLIESTHGIPF
jgi:menaquinone-9 beta-reductase